MSAFNTLFIICPQSTPNFFSMVHVTTEGYSSHHLGKIQVVHYWFPDLAYHSLYHCLLHLLCTGKC